MKKALFFLAAVAFALRLPAQTNPPARLALVAESPDASAAADVLTAEFSSHKNLQLLERNEIEKVYREQGLAAGNRDYLKLGQILGADGLLLLETAKDGTNQFLNVRLMAVKPGVVLVAERFPWPMKNMTEWSPIYARHLDIFLPKLTVLVKDAIPISVVNLRSAVSSSEAQETERQLKLLTIQRLSEERQLFVLERQKMQLLSEEKGLKLDDSAFWNGSYLLEGVVDQSGYSKDTVTINARLTPPKGGTTLPFAVSGARTNLVEVINQLAAKVNEVLKVSSTAPAWNAADEAAQYFDEAKWAIRWGVLPEAQAAADSGWALGKHDLSSAITRVNSYLLEASENVGQIGTMEASYNDLVGYDDAGKPIQDSRIEDRQIQSDIKKMKAEHLWGIDYKETLAGFDKIQITYDKTQKAKVVEYAYFTGPPDPKNIDRALHALELYEESSRTFLNGELKPDWYQLGIDNLTAASRVLQNFNLAPESQKPVADKLAELRAMTRLVAGWISRSVNTTEKKSDILNCEVSWGCFWQETPEDCVAMYRDLMGNPTFEKIQSGLWTRALLSPRMVAWNEAGLNHITNVWENFIQELSTSTNPILHLEGKAFKYRNANGEEDVAAGWAALEDERRDYNNLQAFERQKQYLKENTPFNSSTFVSIFVFGFKDYSKAQAQEIQPLLANYKASLTGKLAQIGVLQVAQVEANVNRILNPSTTPLPSQPPPKVEIPKPVAITKIPVPAPAVTNAPELVTNVISVSKFLAIPLDGLPGDRRDGLGGLTDYDVKITAHHRVEGKLLLDFEYGAQIDTFDEKGNWQQTRGAGLPAIAILDHASEHWMVISCPEIESASQNFFYHRSTLIHGDLYNCDGGQIKKYDLSKGQWQPLAISDGNNYELFAINGNLYAANRDMVFEILDGGKSTRILASTRRNPPASALDRENLGTPTLFEGPNHSLRVCTAKKFYTWSGNDWQEDATMPSTSFPPQIFPDGILYRQQMGFNIESLYSLATEAAASELPIWQKLKFPNANLPRMNEPAVEPPKPLWQMPSGWYFTALPAMLCRSNLYLLADHKPPQGKTNWNGDYNIVLLCFSRSLPLPQKLFLKFESDNGCPPLTGIDPSEPMSSAFGLVPTVWMEATTNQLLFGLEQPKSGRFGTQQNRNCKAGVWMLSISRLEPAIEAQKKLQLAQTAQAASQAIAAAAKAEKDKEQIQKILLAKYDRNHNGSIDADEKGAALDDPAFIEAELDVMDANHNGWLDGDELAYFDANTNRILEPKEQAGMEIAQHMLAERLLKKFDENGDGLLDRSEFDDLVHDSLKNDVRLIQGINARIISVDHADRNHDRYIDQEELEAFLQQQSVKGFRSPGAPGFNPIGRTPGQAVEMFKAAVESYWQNPGGVTNRPPFNNQIPSGIAPVQNNTRPDAAQ